MSSYTSTPETETVLLPHASQTDISRIICMMHETHTDVFPKQDCYCYCRLKMSQPIPTVHPLTAHTNQAKANIEGIVFLGACPAPTDSCQLQAAGRQAAGRPGSPSCSSGLFPTCFPSLSPRHTGSAVRSTEGGGGWLAGCSHSKSKYTWSWNVHARSHMHPCTQTYTSVHTHTHSFPLFLCSCYRVVRFIHTARQEYKCKKGVIVETAKYSSWGGVRFKV